MDGGNERREMEVPAFAEVRVAARHANVSITSAYLHVAVDDEGVGNLFEMTDTRVQPHHPRKFVGSR